MTARIRCRLCRRPVAIITHGLFEFPRYAAGLIDEAAETHGLGCEAAALADVHRVWAGGRP